LARQSATSGRFGSAAKGAAPTLDYTMRNDPDTAVANEAAASLARIGRAGVPYLVTALTHERAAVRQRAAAALAVAGPEARSATPALLKALKDDSRQVRAVAAHALGEVRGDPRLVVPFHPRTNELVLSSRGCTLMQTEVRCPHCQAALAERREGPAGPEDACPQCGAAVARGATPSAPAECPWWVTPPPAAPPEAPWWVTPPLASPGSPGQGSAAREATPPGPPPCAPTAVLADSPPARPRRRRALAGFAAAALVCVGTGVGLVLLASPDDRAAEPPRTQGDQRPDGQASASLPVKKLPAAPQALPRPQGETQLPAPGKRRPAEAEGSPELPRKAPPVEPAAPAPAVLANGQAELPEAATPLMWRLASARKAERLQGAALLRAVPGVGRPRAGGEEAGWSGPGHSGRGRGPCPARGAEEPRAGPAA
jgi:hypothetical protein